MHNNRCLLKAVDIKFCPGVPMRKTGKKAPVIKAIATIAEGVGELISAIEKLGNVNQNEKKVFLLTEKAYRLIQNKRMKEITKSELQKKIKKEISKTDFNLYKFTNKF